MKKLISFLFFSSISIAIQAQTTFNYTSPGTTTYGVFGSTTRFSVLADINSSFEASSAIQNVGILGRATNSTISNYGVMGTTIKNTIADPTSYCAIYGDNVSNQLFTNSSVYGGYFDAYNTGNGPVIGVGIKASRFSFPTNVGAITGADVNTIAYRSAPSKGINILASNPSATLSGGSLLPIGRVIGISSETSVSTLPVLPNIYTDVSNVAGYYKSNSGQGLYSTVNTGYYTASATTGPTIAQAITGYSNVSGIGENIGIIGIAEGSGVHKYGVYGRLVGTASSGISAAIYGNDVINVANTFAGYFDGKVNVVGNLTVSGNSSASGVKTFRIDHPLDPENKILRHAAMESNEVLNQYSGNISTDSDGLATVILPNYFEALNKDFRYQLTAIGTFAQAIIKAEVANNQFIIQTNQPNTKVSWQITGVRNDKVMIAKPFIAESIKEGDEIGKYISPEVYGKVNEQ